MWLNPGGADVKLPIIGPECVTALSSSLQSLSSRSTHYSPLPHLGTLSSNMFERTLQDLIRGLRAHKASSRAQEDAFLNEALGEIREELRGKDMALKAEAILKMSYVGQSREWADRSS